MYTYMYVYIYIYTHTYIYTLGIIYLNIYVYIHTYIHTYMYIHIYKERPLWWLSSKQPTCQCRRPGFDPWVGKIPWRRKWEPTLVFLPGKFHGQRSLEGYSPRGLKEPGTSQQLNNNNNIQKENQKCAIFYIKCYETLY